MENLTGNRLANESSPYLLQHAANPVHWHPWDDTALALARRENKPVLLSIGYSACHWCHVMAHESFEDQATAGIMNQLFVNIKVDREERPDLDKIYQDAHQLLNQRPGGWPLTVILTPDDHTPFFAGTYFPKQPRHGMPAFVDILQRVENFYRENNHDIRQQNDSLREAMAGLHPGGNATARISSAPLDEARHQLAHNFDSAYGGFGQAPKFPHPTSLERLLRHWASTRLGHAADEHAHDMLRTSLHAMASGGIYDQLGGGFCRYSVDEKWMIPHFEKMLYDNGPLLCIYTQAWLAFGAKVFRRIATETAEWIMREMQSEEGGYYSTLDADSEGEEGRFYVWEVEQIRSLLTEEEYAITERIYGLDQAANFEDRRHLHVYVDLEQVAAEFGMNARQTRQHFNKAREKMLAARELRIHPGRDEKILTSWNGLMIKGMAVAGRHLQRDDFVRSAQQSIDFIRNNLFQDGRLSATYKDQRARLMAYLDDYVFLIDGLLELLQTQWRDQDLQFAIELADTVLEHFEDKQDGGFYFTADDHEALFHRPKPTLDEAIPAGNGIAAYVLTRLGHLIGNTRYLQAGERTIQYAWQGIRQVPHAHCSLLLAVEEYLYPPQCIVIRADNDTAQQWLSRCHQYYAPRRMSFAIPSDSHDLPGTLAEKGAHEQPRAYICDASYCRPPVSEFHELDTILKSNELGAD